MAGVQLWTDWWKMKPLNLYTYSGRIAFPEGAPSILDIAVSLSRECRFAGAGLAWWPVALHSFVVSDLLPENLKIYGLLHDAAECILGDIPKPAKSDETARLEASILDAIYRDLGLVQPQGVEDAIHAADFQTLCGEVWTVGTLALREIYDRHSQAEQLVDYYRRCYPVEDCVGGEDAPCVREFLRRYNEYRRSSKPS